MGRVLTCRGQTRDRRNTGHGLTSVISHHAVQIRTFWILFFASPQCETS